MADRKITALDPVEATDLSNDNTLIQFVNPDRVLEIDRNRRGTLVDLTNAVLQRAPGRLLIDVVVYDTPGTFAFLKASYPSLSLVQFYITGSGGGGGGCAVTNNNQVALGGGGGGGAWGYGSTLASALGASAAVVVGAGGAGGSAGANGSAGAASSFEYEPATVATRSGGGAGSAGAALSVAGRSGRAGSGGGGATTGFEVVGIGHVADDGLVFPTVAWSGGNGGAGAGPFGSGGAAARPPVASGDGLSALSYMVGAGGSGGANAQNQATARAGGSGGDGLVVLYLYA